MSIRQPHLLAVLLVVTAAACAGAVAPPTAAPSTGTATAAPGGATFDQAWAVASLTDVATGDQFRIADLAAPGKVVFVETMAIWCTNCRVQQMEAAAALAELDQARVEWVVLDVETSESADALARYRDQHGFPFRYAIAGVDLSRSLATDFGDVVLSPPSVNIIVLGTAGQVTHLLGHHSAADILTIAHEHGA